MKAYLVCLDTSIVGTAAHEIMFAESKGQAEEDAWVKAVENAESYGITQGEEFFHEEEDEDEEVGIECYVMFEVNSEASLEEADGYRCGGGSFRYEILEEGVQW